LNSIKAEAATRKTRRELLKEIDPEYYGYLDDDEYLLLDEEEKHEREGILSIFILYKRIKIIYYIDLKLDKKRSNCSMRIRWIQINKKRRRQRVKILNPMAKYFYE
jgi:hypothetical protein